MNNEEWGFLPGTWNVFENSHGWRLTLDTSRLPGRMELQDRREYAAALLYALNNGMPEQGTNLTMPGTNTRDQREDGTIR